MAGGQSELQQFPGRELVFAHPDFDFGGSSDFGGVGVVFWGCWGGVLVVL